MSLPEGGGNAFALPSPTHAHQMDVTSAVRSLRRSISRSPSRFLSRTSSRSSEGSTPASPQSPCRRFHLTPQNRQQDQSSSHAQTAPPAAHFTQGSSNAPHSPSFTPLRSSTKLSLRSAKSARTASPSRQLARARASPKSPLRRALNATTDQGNAAAQQSNALYMATTGLALGQENNQQVAASPAQAQRSSIDKPSRHSLHLDVSGSSENAFLKALDAKIDPAASNAGGLKRNDAMMNLDQPYQGSPVPKRRSMHGVSNHDQGGERGIFGSNQTVSAGFKIHEDTSRELEVASMNGSESHRDFRAAPPIPALAPPRRSSSLRKSTMIPRAGDKGSWGKRAGQRQLAQMEFDNTSTPAKPRAPVAGNQFDPPNGGGLPSSTPLGTPSFPFSEARNGPGHHPLAQTQTLSASSSGNTLTEEISNYAPAPPPTTFGAPSFSRSLPLGAERPTIGHSTLDQATPNPGSLLYQGAFGSTGLISKVNRNPEQLEKKLVPPDTPCKPWRKQTDRFNTYPVGGTPSAAKKNRTNNRNSFAGISSLTFQPPSDNPRQGHSIFDPRPPHSRDLGSQDDDGDTSLFDEIHDERVSANGLAPPTPTKNGMTPSFSNLSYFSEQSEQGSDESLDSPSANRKSFGPRDGPPLSAVRPTPLRQPNCKYNLHPAASSISANNDASVAASCLPSNPGNNPSAHVISFGRSRTSRGLKSPVHLGRPQPDPPFLFSSREVFAKIPGVGAASPVGAGRTPRTPQELSLPDNIGQLSASRPSIFGGVGDGNGLPPATPTTERDFRSSTALFSTPVHEESKFRDDNIEPTLQQRFDDVTKIGDGEFSLVYRVKERSDPLGSDLPNFVTEPGNVAPVHGRVSVVKKSKHPYRGGGDRARQLKEARILQALREAEHVVQYLGDWEMNDHLYIQTEFCENGSLKDFYSREGFFGRLDDFCILKILLDLTLGLKEIHDAGFMHLDMKPANVLITFEGALKIGDFGLARSLSETDPLHMEGDREYMAPEMLHGKFGCSSDIFSLGMIVFEAIANVEIPGNGEDWHKLRSGDFSGVPSLAWTASCETNPHRSGLYSDEYEPDRTHDAGDLFGSHKRSELLEPPAFMEDAANPESLRSMVSWMMVGNIQQRPTASQLLSLGSLQWVAERRTAPATIFEGRWGPVHTESPANVEVVDTEMTGV